MAQSQQPPLCPGQCEPDRAFLDPGGAAQGPCTEVSPDRQRDRGRDTSRLWNFAKRGTMSAANIYSQCSPHCRCSAPHVHVSGYWTHKWELIKIHNGPVTEQHTVHPLQTTWELTWKEGPGLRGLRTEQNSRGNCAGLTPTRGVRR